MSLYDSDYSIIYDGECAPVTAHQPHTQVYVT